VKASKTDRSREICQHALFLLIFLQIHAKVYYLFLNSDLNMQARTVFLKGEYKYSKLSYTVSPDLWYAGIIKFNLINSILHD